MRKRLGPNAARVEVLLVSVSVDPERDTPEVLREYVKGRDPSFIALHGDANATGDMAKEFKVIHQKVPTLGSYARDHTAIKYALELRARLQGAINLPFTQWPMPSPTISR